MTGKLILSLDGNVIKEYVVGKEPLTIGRKHDNDIQLNDSTVSGRHALISWRPGFVFIEDLGSTNGTLVNGYHIDKVALEHGNVVQIGHHQFTYLAQGASKYEPTMFIKAEMDETQMVLPAWDLDDLKQPKGQPLGGLKVLNGPMADTLIELRKAYNTIGFKGKKLARVSRGIEGYTIMAVVATGVERQADEIPQLNGERMPEVPVRLNPGDIINIVGFDMEFQHIH